MAEKRAAKSYFVKKTRHSDLQCLAMWISHLGTLEN